MLSTTAVLFFLALLLLGVVLEPWAARRYLPRGVLFVALGYLGSECATRLGLDTGVRWDNFNFVISSVLLPILIFSAALKLRSRDLWRDALPIALLVLPVMIVTVLIAALILYAGIGHVEGFPPAIALLTAAILAATDSGAAVHLLRALRGPERLVTLLEGESLFNDASAVVIFMLLLGFTMPGTGFPGAGAAAVLFLKTFLGGIGTGLLFGALCLWLLRLAPHEHMPAAATLFCAYGSFLIAQNVLGVSGVMAVLAAGLLFGGRRKDGGGPDHAFTERFWDFAAAIGSALIFLLAGVTVTWSMFQDQWLAMLIGIAALLLARSMTLFGIFGPLTRLPRVDAVPGNYNAVLAWSGAPGTFGMALALSLPLALGSWYTVQATVYGVVLFGLFVQSTTLPFLLRRLRLS